MKSIISASLLSLLCSTAFAAETFTIATDATYPPFESIDANGKLVGFEVDLAYALCAQIKMQCNVVNQAWDGLIPGLNAKKHDAIMASMNITDERRKVVMFSDVYYRMQNRFVAKKGQAINIDAEGLKGKIISVQTGTPQDKFVTAQFGKIAKIQRHVNAQNPMLELVNSRAQLTFGNTVQLQKGFLESKDGANFEFIGPVFDGRKDKVLGEGVAVALRKSDTEMAMKFNAAIKAIKANGVYESLLKKHQLNGLLQD